MYFTRLKMTFYEFIISKSQSLGWLTYIQNQLNSFAMLRFSLTLISSFVVLATLTQIYAKANKKTKHKAVMIIPPLKTIC